jgi:hypothetical protein
MLTIRNAQMEPFREAAVARFVARLLPRLRAMFPEVLAPVGDERLTEIARAAVDQARAHGVVYERDVARYVAYSIHLGASFDTDPDLPWAGAVLRDEALDGKEKMERLDAEVRRVFGAR